MPHPIQSLLTAYDTADAFQTFWAVYPRKTAKVIARRAFDKALPKTTLAVLLAAVEREKRTDQWRRNVIPHAATWLRQERWLDELPLEPDMGREALRDQGRSYIQKLMAERESS